MLLRWLNKLAMESTEPQHGFVNSISFWNLFVFRYNGSDSLWNSALPHDILVEILSGDKSAAFFIIRLFAVFLFFDPVIVYLIKRVKPDSVCVCISVFLLCSGPHEHNLTYICLPLYHHAFISAIPHLMSTMVTCRMYCICLHPCFLNHSIVLHKWDSVWVLESVYSIQWFHMHFYIHLC